MKLISEITDEAKKIIKFSKNFDEIGYLLNEYWKIKKSLNKFITNSKIDNIYKSAISSGAIGGKLLGAGAGGFMLFYVPSKNRHQFKLKMRKTCIIPVEFEHRGSTIIKNI
jgi:D-glycero-alpha-D-manno-heptose-7-phosphate kinase